MLDAEERLDSEIGRYDSLLVAFSGGADSALLLAAAVRVLGTGSVVAATAVSDSLAAGEWEAATHFVRSLGVQHEAVRTHELQRDGYRDNGPDRCYFCKDELLTVLTPVARASRMAAIATGTNADDVRARFRPGIRAAAAHGAVTPLADAALTKENVRQISRRWGLPTWDKPQAACLSSRIAYGISITPARLARVDRAESAIRSLIRERGLSITDVRVRDLGVRARVEVDAAQVASLRGLPELGQVLAASGFDEWELDPRGFRSGSMNDPLIERSVSR